MFVDAVASTRRYKAHLPSCDPEHHFAANTTSSIKQSMSADSFTESFETVEDEDRRDSYSSVELEDSIADGIMDSLDGTFVSTLAEGRTTEPLPSSVPAGDEKALVEPNAVVENLILASRALHRVGKAEANSCVYTLRRNAQKFGSYDNKAEFVRAFKSIKPPEMDDPEPEYVNQISAEKYSDYALARLEEAYRTLGVDNYGQDARVREVEKCLMLLRDCVRTWKRDWKQERDEKKLAELSEGSVL